MQYIYLFTYSFIINDKIERSLILSTFSHLYFITSRFSIYGFPIYKVVFLAVLDKVMDDPGELNNILNILKLSSDEKKSIETSRIVFYLLVVEQSMRELDDEIIENEILPLIYPYPFIYLYARVCVCIYMYIHNFLIIYYYFMFSLTIYFLINSLDILKIKVKFSYSSPHML